MEQCFERMILILCFIAFGLTGHHSTEALQCYVCDDCVDGTELEAMQICGELLFESTSSATPTQSTTNRPTTLSSTQTNSSTTSNVSTGVGTTTRRPTTTTTRRPTTISDSDSEENYSDYEDSDEGDRRRHFSFLENDFEAEKPKGNSFGMRSLKQDEPVCYVVRYRVNNTRIASLGCTSMVQNNIFLTCLSLNRTGADMENCELCGKNGCNKKIFLNETQDDWDYPWYNAGGRNQVEILYCVLLLLVLKLVI